MKNRLCLRLRQMPIPCRITKSRSTALCNDAMCMMPSDTAESRLHGIPHALSSTA